jgi:hypothetical protein
LGTTYLAARIGVREIPGLFLAALRQIISGSILLIYFFVKGYSVPDRETLKKILVQGFFHALPWQWIIDMGLYSNNQQWPGGHHCGINSFVSCLIQHTFFKNASLTKPMLIGLLIGMVGIGAIFYEYLDDLLNPQFAVGILLNLAAITCWAIRYGVHCAKQF